MLQCHVCSAAGRQAALPSRTRKHGNAGGAGTHRVHFVVGGPCRIKATLPSGPRQPSIAPSELGNGETVQSAYIGVPDRDGCKEGEQMSRALHVPVEPGTMPANGGTLSLPAHLVAALVQKRVNREVADIYGSSVQGGTPR